MYKIDYTKLGESSMSGYHTNHLSFYLRTWTNMATNARKFEVVLDFDTEAVLDKAEWDYIINCLTYVLNEARTGLQAEYRFSLRNGILFKTSQSDGILVSFPDASYSGYKFSFECINDWVKCLNEAKKFAK